MSRVFNDLPQPGEAAADARRELISRIGGSRTFAKAPQLRELLLYLSDRAIDAPAEELSEREIGCRVWRRPHDYDPQSDNIVRVQIRRLRQKLDEYFAGEGRDEPLLVTLPKGGHQVHFEARAGHVEPSAPGPVTGSGMHGRLRWGAAIGALAVTAFLAGRYSVRGAASLVPEQAEVFGGSFWNRLFVKGEPTTIVVSDSNLALAQDISRQSVTLKEYADRSYRNRFAALPDPALRETLRLISGRQHTSLSDAVFSGKLRSAGVRTGAKVDVRYARNMNIRDFHTGSFILLGSRLSMPWVELFEPKLNFCLERIGMDPRFAIRNRQPRSGEAALYGDVGPSTESTESFASISVLPNLANRGTVLILSGLTMEATEAAGEYLMSAEFSALLGKLFGAGSARELRSFEVVLKTAVMAGAPYAVQAVAWRSSGA